MSSKNKVDVVVFSSGDNLQKPDSKLTQTFDEDAVITVKKSATNADLATIVADCK
ncbi:hypothetical protein [Lacticaseibacillus nasuensis]|uniref:hypothetical protein n=1 Tax=Lacticaseibacillus nasuensis TaxID=944671 RepID=UPI000A88FCD2|nr:hypothetical protein [Lacticaseibacillus nasuensis]